MGTIENMTRITLDLKDHEIQMILYALNEVKDYYSTDQIQQNITNCIEKINNAYKNGTIITKIKE